MKLTIKAKLTSLLYSAFFILIILITSLLIKLNTDSVKGYDKLSETSSKKLILLLKIRKNADNIEFALLKQILDTSKEKRHEMQEIIFKENNQNDSIYAEYQKLITTDIEKKLFSQLSSSRKQNKEQRQLLLNIDYSSITNLNHAIYYQRHVQQESYEKYQMALNEIIDYEENVTRSMLDKLDSIFVNAIIPICICIFLIIIILIVLGILIRKHLIKLNIQNTLLKENKNQIIAAKNYSDSVINAAPTGIIGVNEQNIITLFNYQSEIAFGYSKSEVIGQSISILIPDNIQIKSQQNSILQHSSYNSMLSQHPAATLLGKRKNGEIFSIELSVGSTETENGTIKIVGIKDITEKKETEKRLLQLAEINRNTRTFVGIATIDRRIIYLNPSFKKALGFLPDDDYNGLLTTDIYQEKIKAKMAKALQETIANGIWIGENEIQNSEGKLIPVIQTILLHKDEDGNPEYTSTTMIEITDLKHKENELIKINKLFETLSNATKLLVNLTTLDAFLNDICNLIIQSGNFNLAWIGEFDQASSLMIPIGWGGDSKRYLQEIEIKVDPNAKIKGPTATALLEGIPFISNDFYEKDNTKEWQEKARKYGIASSAVIPFKLKEKTVGTINIYSTEKDYFQEPEIALIKEIGSIISIGITKIKEEKERKKIEENRAQLSSIIENTNAFVSITNLDGTYIYMNDTARKGLGFDKDDISSYNIRDVFSPESAKKLNKEIIPALLKENIWKGEVDFITRNNKRIYVLLVTFLHRDANGNPLYRSSTAIDITEQKLKEKEKNQLARVIENSSLFVGMANLDRKSIYMNANFKHALNIPLDEDITKIDVGMFNTPNSAAGKSEIIKTVYEKGIWVGESEMMARDGRVFPIIQSIVLHRDLNGEPDFTSTTVLDITDIKTKEKELTKLTGIIENAASFAGVASLDHTCIFFNESMRAALEIEKDEDITLYKITDFLTPISNKYTLEVAFPIMKEKGKWIGQTEWISRKTKKIIPVIQTIILHRNENGEPEYASTTAIDISELKIKEKQLVVLNEELRSLYHELQEIREEERKMIAKEIHDELGQNLTALKLFISWIKSHINADKNLIIEKLDEFEKVTNETVDTSRRLYNNLYPQMLTDVGIVGALQWLLNSYKNSSSIDIEFNTNIDQKKGMEIDGKISLAIFRIYQECFTNILRYANANLVVIELNIQKQQIVLSIEDDGIGFEVEKVDTSAHHGLLGMRERAISLNGTIVIDSIVGRGTKTTVCIPISNIN